MSAIPIISIWLFALPCFASPTFRKTAGATTAASVAMMAMTTTSSISVNPERRCPVLASALHDT